MPYHWEFRSYQRRFKQALQTNHGCWAVREGVILRLVDQAGNISWGEIAPLPWFGSETLEQALEFCHQLPAVLTDDLIFAVPDTLPCCQFAFESAWKGLQESAIGQTARQRDRDAGKQAPFITTSSTLRPQSSELPPQNSTLRDQSSIVAVQSSTLRDQSSTLRPQNSVIAAQSSTLRDQSSIVAAQSLTLRDQNSELPPQNSTLRDQSSIVAAQNSTLRDQSSIVAVQSSNIAVQSSTLRDQNSDVVVQSSIVAVQNLIRQPQSPVIAAPIPAPFPTPHSPLPTLPYSALLPAGDAALHTWQPLWKQGFRTFKWKIGVQAIATELKLLAALIQTLPKPAKLRLDANGGLSTDEATQWLQACDAMLAPSNRGSALEYIEQPLPIAQFETMQTLSQQYRTPIALDESVATLQQLQTCYDNGWRGIFVIKPAIVGSPSRLRQFCQHHPIDAVFSSALETAIGRQAGLRLAASLGNPDRAVGYGTTHWFEDLESDDVEQLWQTL